MLRCMGLLASCTVLAACQVFDASLLDAEPSDAGTQDASDGVDAGPDAGPGDAGPGCDLRRPPPRPEGSDDGEDAGELIFVLHHFTIDQTEERWRTIGWDLDGLCSYAPDFASECIPRAASSVPEEDGENGIDNSLGHNILDALIAAFPDLMDALSGHEWGHGSILLRVRGWNGLPDDPRVDVTIAQTIIGTPRLPDGGVPEVTNETVWAREWPELPRWDGNDAFWIRSASFVDGDPEQPRLRDDNAYVRDRVLVVNLPQRVPVVFNNSYASFIVHFTDSRLAARISEDATHFEWASFGGRWPVADLLATLPAAGICVGSEYYRVMERISDLIADLRAEPGTGGGGAFCDAISGGLGGQGHRAHLAGMLTAYDDPPNACERMMMDAGVPDAGIADAGLPDAAIMDGGALD